jgi:hypothetical protein
MQDNNARADETLRLRMVTHAVSVQSHDVGDLAGHSISLARFSGLAFFPDVPSRPAASTTMAARNRVMLGNAQERDRSLAELARFVLRTVWSVVSRTGWGSLAGSEVSQQR